MLIWTFNLSAVGGHGYNVENEENVFFLRKYFINRHV